jgi:hypothetical protein
VAGLGCLSFLSPFPAKQRETISVVCQQHKHADQDGNSAVAGVQSASKLHLLLITAHFSAPG